MFGGLTGVIEGFYGRPWAWDERLDVMAWCHERAMTHYVYAPKDDPLHRERWRDPYGDDDLDGFARLVAAETLRVGFAVSPGLTIDYTSDADRSALLAKVEQVTALGIDLIVLALDDIPPSAGLGTAHGGLTAWLVDRLGDRAQVVLVPTDYTSIRPVPYLTELAASCPAEVPVAWTGPTVVCDEISVADAEGRAAALAGRLPLVWDNYPVNDSVMGDRLFLGPLRGRDPGLAGVTSGWLANPMVQPASSMLPLSSVAAYLRGADPVAAWEADADALGIRTFAEACDGEHPARLVDALIGASEPATWAAALADLRTWCKAVQALSSPVLGGEGDEWLAAAQVEAGTCLQAVRVLEAMRAVGPRAGQDPDPKAVMEGSMVLAVLGQDARRSTRCTFGPRNSIRPVFSQHDDGEWRFHAAAVQTDQNATDRLVAYTLALVDAEP
jgi:hyaluronoglucosaminidase